MISVLCPTRNRVQMFKRMAETALATSPQGVEIVAYVDDDDPALKQYRQLGLATVHVGPRRRRMTEYWNELIPLAKGDILCQGNDDVVFSTPNWATMVETTFAACADKILMVHGDDLGCNGSGAGPHPFVHRRWIEEIGYFIPPYFSSDYGDSWINDVADRIGRRRFLPFIMEHLHYVFGKAEIDQTTRERLERHKYDNPGKLYEQLEPKRADDARKLRALMSSPKLTIMILTQPCRKTFLNRLMDGLLPQLVKRYDVEILTEQFDDELSLGENRERMRQNAAGEYICFVDDDDVLAKDYIARIMPMLAGVDYVGFKVQTSIDGNKIPVTTHSIQNHGVGANEKGNFRDISHLNPMRRELALQASMEGEFGEDSRWADEIRRMKLIKTEHYIDEVLYYYEARSVKNEAKPKTKVATNRPLRAHLPAPPNPFNKFGHPPNVNINMHAMVNAGRVGNYANQSIMCRSCGSSAIVPNPSGRRCNQCGSIQ